MILPKHSPRIQRLFRMLVSFAEALLLFCNVPGEESGIRPRRGTCVASYTGASRCRPHEVNMFEKSPIDQTVTGALLNFDHYHMDNQMFLFRNLPDGRVR